MSCEERTRRPWSSVRTLVIACCATFVVACGARVGYRYSYRDSSATGIYAGPFVGVTVPTAGRLEKTGSSPFVQLQADYAFATGPDFATLGGGVAFAPGAGGGYHTTTGVMVAWEPWHGMGLHLNLCSAWGNWGEIGACLRWSSKGYVGVDAMGGFSGTRLMAEAHNDCVDKGGCDGGGDFDWD